MRYKTVADSMTPLESVYMLNITGKIDGATMREVCESMLCHGKGICPLIEGMP